MKTFDYFKLLIIALLSNFIISFTVCKFLNYPIFDINNWTYQFIIFSFFSSVFFANYSILKPKINLLIIGILLIIHSIIFSFLELYPYYKFYSILSFLILPAIIIGFFLFGLYLFWFRIKLRYARALLFSLTSAFVYSLVLFLGQKIFLLKVFHLNFMYYFSNSLLIFISISLGFNIVSLLINRILPEYSFEQKTRYTLKEADE